MTSPHETYLQTKFFGSLDGLRALSIIGVVWVHAWLGTPEAPYLQAFPILRGGLFGIEIFFTVSGFLITTLLLRERAMRGRISLRDFYVRRALRIWPLYYSMLGVYVVLTLLTQHETERGREFFHYLPTYLTYTYTWFGPRGREPLAIFNFAWSLSTEEQFYFFWSLALVYLRRPWPVVLLIATILLKVLTRYGLMYTVLPVDSLAEHIVMSFEVPICLGVLLAILLNEPRGFRALYYFLGRRFSAPVALAVLMLSLANETPMWSPLAWPALALLVAACVIREDHGLAVILRWRPLAFLGVISYGMYLMNTLVIKALRPALGYVGIHHPLIVFPPALAVTIFVAWLSYRYFESPFLALKSKFSHLHPAPAEAAAVKVMSAETHRPVHP